MIKVRTYVVVVFDNERLSVSVIQLHSRLRLSCNRVTPTCSGSICSCYIISYILIQKMFDQIIIHWEQLLASYRKLMYKVHINYYTCIFYNHVKIFEQKQHHLPSSEPDYQPGIVPGVFPSNLKLTKTISVSTKEDREFWEVVHKYISFRP